MEQLRLHCPDDPADAPDDAARTWLQHLGHSVLRQYPLSGSVDIVLTDDAQLQRLNASFRNIDRPTDVLSFSMTQGQPLIAGDEEDQVAGEIYVSLERARSQAVEYDASLTEELGRLLVHGLLHLAGYEHDTEESLRFMENETQRFLDLRPRASEPTGTDAHNSCPGG